MVTSLTFITNRQTYGPFGRRREAHSVRARVVSVIGRSGSFLDAIGFITEVRGPVGRRRREFYGGQGVRCRSVAAAPAPSVAAAAAPSPSLAATAAPAHLRHQRHLQQHHWHQHHRW